MLPNLSIVADSSVESLGAKVRRLQAEAKNLAKDHMKAFSAAIVDAERIAHEIAEGGDAYPAGVRDLARRFIDEADARIQTIEAIAARS